MSPRGRERALEVQLDEVVRVVSDRTGLDLAGCHRDRMVKVVRDAWLDAGAPRPDAYDALVTDDAARWERLVDRLTIGETYFFRDLEQLEAVVATVRTAAHGGRRVRIWSAGCATGEEPYSVAILLGEEGLLERCEIVGTDLSPHAIDRARTARYSRWSLRRCTPAQRSAYFEPDGDRFHLRRRFVEAVRFSTHNMVGTPPATDAFDVVLCRNVLMYLSPQALVDATASLRDALCPGGRLFLGPTDPIPATAGLQRVSNGPAFAHQRAVAGPAERAQPPVRPAPPAPPVAPAPAVRHRPRRAPVAPPPVAEPAAPHEPRVVEAITAAAVEDHIARGDHAAAWELLARAVAADPLDASLRCLMAALHLEAGDPGAAATAARAALYLDASLAVAHFVLGQAEHRCGNRDRARRSFRNTVEALSGLPSDAVVPLAGGRTASSLRETAAILADR